MGREYPVRTESASQVISQALVEERVTAILASFFAGLALLLASIGLYGLMSHAVTHRAREIGIRVALEAQNRNILRIVLSETAALSLLGLAIGIPCGLASSRLIASMLFGISSNDFSNIVKPCPLLLAMALFAGYIPARRASRIDPVVALRADVTLVNGDPVANISDIRKTALVMKDGVLYRPGELYSAVGVAP